MNNQFLQIHPGVALSKQSTIGKFFVYFNNASYEDYIIQSKEFFIYQKTFFNTIYINPYTQTFTNEFVLGVGLASDQYHYSCTFSLKYYRLLQHYIDFFSFSSLNLGLVYLGKFRNIKNFARTKSIPLAFKFNSNNPFSLKAYFPEMSKKFNLSYSILVRNFGYLLEPKNYYTLINKNLVFIKYALYNLLIYRFNLIYNKVFTGRFLVFEKFLTAKYAFYFNKHLNFLGVYNTFKLKFIQEIYLYLGISICLYFKYKIYKSSYVKKCIRFMSSKVYENIGLILSITRKNINLTTFNVKNFFKNKLFQYSNIFMNLVANKFPKKRKLYYYIKNYKIFNNVTDSKESVTFEEEKEVLSLSSTLPEEFLSIIKIIPPKGLSRIKVIAEDILPPLVKMRDKGLVAANVIKQEIDKNLELLSEFQFNTFDINININSINIYEFDVNKLDAKNITYVYLKRFKKFMIAEEKKCGSDSFKQSILKEKKEVVNKIYQKVTTLYNYTNKNKITNKGKFSV
jgi:hypothetical protein